MIKEVFYLVPRLAESELAQMEKSLSGRFSKIAKGFGRGLQEVIKGEVALAILEKILNPLNEVKAAIDSALGRGDDIKSFAKEFGSDSGNLARLQAIAQAKGVDAHTLNEMILKFKDAVDQAAQDPTKQTSVRQFVGEKDFVSAFTKFQANLQNLNQQQRGIVQQEIFGQRATLKVAGFLGTDLSKLDKEIGGASAKDLSKTIDSLSGLSDLKGRLEARRNLDDLGNKGRGIGKDAILAVDASERAKQKRIDEDLKNVDKLQKAQDAIDDIQHKMGEILSHILTDMPIVLNSLQLLVKLLDTSVKGWGLIGQMMKESPLIRGISVPSWLKGGK